MKKRECDKIVGYDRKQVKCMEWLDIVNEQGIPTGERVERNRAHTEGILHRTVHTWIVREQGGRIQVLLQKRSMEKESFPGRFDTSSAGHIQAGDEPLVSAQRELAEELGIEAGENELTFVDTFRVQYEKEFHGRLFRDNEIAFVHIYTAPVEIEKLVLQESEVEVVEWFDLEEVYEGCKQHDRRFCVPIGGLNVIRSYLLGEKKQNV